SGRDYASHEARRTIHCGGRCGHGTNRIPTSCGGRRRRRGSGVGRDGRPDRACKPWCGGGTGEKGGKTTVGPKNQEKRCTRMQNGGSRFLKIVSLAPAQWCPPVLRP